jgi:outer membrane protein assembly factor BamB
VREHRRLSLAAAAAAVLAATGGILAWLVLGFLPIRGAVNGPFFAWSQTPAESTRNTARETRRPSWPMFGGSPARVRYAASALRPPFKVRYAISGGGTLIEMPPAISRGRAVFGTHEGLVIAFRLRDGKILWRTPLQRCIASAPAVRDGVVYIGWSGIGQCRRKKDDRGGLIALSLATGEVLWRFRAGNVESSPAFVGNTLYFSGFRSRQESRVFAMRIDAPRRIIWSYPVPTKIASSPALIGRTVYVSAYNQKVYALDARTGRLRWETSALSDASQARFLLGMKSLVTRGSWTETGYYATPAIAYERFYLGTIDGVFSAFDVDTGAHRWSRRLNGSVYSSAALWHETAYIGTTNGVFYALAARNGRELWKHDLEGKIFGSATVTNGRVYIATTTRETYVFDARTGRLEWRFPDGEYSPLVVAGRRGVLVGKGRVYGVVNGVRTTGWIPR